MCNKLYQNLDLPLPSQISFYLYLYPPTLHDALYAQHAHHESSGCCCCSDAASLLAATPGTSARAMPCEQVRVCVCVCVCVVVVVGSGCHDARSRR
jgi:hypothetical protein